MRGIWNYVNLDPHRGSETFDIDNMFIGGSSGFDGVVNSGKNPFLEQMLWNNGGSGGVLDYGNGLWRARKYTLVKSPSYPDLGFFLFGMAWNSDAADDQDFEYATNDGKSHFYDNYANLWSNERANAIEMLFSTNRKLYRAPSTTNVYNDAIYREFSRYSEYEEITGDKSFNESMVMFLSFDRFKSTDPNSMLGAEINISSVVGNMKISFDHPQLCNWPKIKHNLRSGTSAEQTIEFSGSGVSTITGMQGYKNLAIIFYTVGGSISIWGMYATQDSNFIDPTRSHNLSCPHLSEADFNGWYRDYSNFITKKDIVEDSKNILDKNKFFGWLDQCDNVTLSDTGTTAANKSFFCRWDYYDRIRSSDNALMIDGLRLRVVCSWLFISTRRMASTHR
jgi:hypothetical protein